MNDLDNDLNNDKNDDNNQNNCKDYVGVVKKVKKDNITPDNIGEIMLCQSPGISSVTALAVMEKYKTIQNLIKELELNSECLKDLSYTNTKGQVRKISKTPTKRAVLGLVLLTGFSSIILLQLFFNENP